MTSYATHNPFATCCGVILDELFTCSPNFVAMHQIKSLLTYSLRALARGAAV